MALNFKTEGILHKIDPIQQITETFKKRNIVVESEEFKELCKNITEAVKMLLKEAFKADNKEIPDNNDKKTE